MGVAGRGGDPSQFESRDQIWFIAIVNCREKFEEYNGSQLGGNFYRYKYMISSRIIKSTGVGKD